MANVFLLFESLFCVKAFTVCVKNGQNVCGCAKTNRAVSHNHIDFPLSPTVKDKFGLYSIALHIGCVRGGQTLIATSKSVVVERAG